MLHSVPSAFSASETDPPSVIATQSVSEPTRVVMTVVGSPGSSAITKSTDHNEPSFLTASEAQGPDAAEAQSVSVPTWVGTNMPG